MTELFPGLEKLRGGKKQHWIRSNLDLISALNDNLGFQETARVLNMKSDTLAAALEKSERGHRPSIKESTKAMNKALINSEEIYAIKGELERQGEEIENHIGEDQQLREHLQQYFELQAAANTIMSKLLSGVSHASNLTYHIGSPNKRKVGPSKAIRSGRLLLFLDPGRQVPGSVVKKNKPYHRRRSFGGY